MGKLTGTDRAPAEGYIRKANAAGDEVWSRIAEASSVAACLVTHSATQAATAGSSVLTFNTEIVDADGMHSPTVNPERITIAIPGVYNVSIAAHVASGPVGSDRNTLEIVQKNSAGTTIRRAISAMDEGQYELSFASNFSCAAGDYFTVGWFATSFTGGIAGGQDYSPNFSAVRIGDASGLAELTVPYAHVYHTATQSVPTSTEVLLSYNSERGDTDNIHDTATNNSRLTCKTAGRYFVSAHVEWSPNSSGQRSIRFRKNGSDVTGAYGPYGTDSPVASPDAGFGQVHAAFDLVVGDYLEVIVWQNSGSTLTIGTSGAVSYRGCEFQMTRIGRATGSVGGEAWIAPTLLNGWVNQGGDAETVAYYKDPNGRVWLKGAGNPGSGGTTHIFTLPVGYRPGALSVEGAVRYWTGSASALGNYHINASGEVRLNNNAATFGGPPNIAYSLNGISFRAA